MNTSPVSGIFSVLEADFAKLALTPLTNIRGAISAIQAAPGDGAVLLEQEAVIIANANTLIAEAPAVVPLLRQAAIAEGADVIGQFLDKVITTLNGVANPSAAASAEGEQKTA